MKKIMWSLVPIIVATGSVLPNIVYSQTGPKHEQGTPSHTAVAAETKGEAYSPTADLQGEHRMVGKITRIDHSSGRVTVSTEEAGDLDLHYPPESVANLKEGDSVTVYLGFSRSAGTAKKEQANKKMHKGWERNKFEERPGGCPGGFPCPK